MNKLSNLEIVELQNENHKFINEICNKICGRTFEFFKKELMDVYDSHYSDGMEEQDMVEIVINSLTKLNANLINSVINSLGNDNKLEPEFFIKTMSESSLKILLEIRNIENGRKNNYC